MIKAEQIFKIIPFLILLIAIYSVTPYLNLTLGNITFWWIVQAFILYIIFVTKMYFYDKGNQQDMSTIKWYLIWNIFSLFRGIFIAETYWDYKELTNNLFVLLMPIIAYPSTNLIIVQAIQASYIKYALPLFFVIIFFVIKAAYGLYLVPISLLIFFIPLIKFHWKFIILFFSLLVLISDLGARSNIIKFIIPFSLLLLYFTRNLISVKILEIVRKIIIIVPFFIFYLAVNNIFNPFNLSSYIKGEHLDLKKNEKGEMEEEDLLSDTRTFLYEDVLQTADKYNSWLVGRSPARGNETEAFADLKEIYGRAERYSNEVAILNIFTWTGVIGVLLYFFIFYKATYLAINSSNNIFSKMLGLYIAFRWVYAWIEDINEFSLNYFFIWIMLGICFSKSFRNLSDEEVKVWVEGIFDKRCRKIYVANTLH